MKSLYLNSTYSRFSQHLISLVILANNFANSTIGMFQRLLVIFSFLSWWKSLTTLNGISQRRSGRVDRCWSRWRWISGTLVPNRWRSHVYIAIKVCDSSVSSEGKKWWTNIYKRKIGENKIHTLRLLQIFLKLKCDQSKNQFKSVWPLKMHSEAITDLGRRQKYFPRIC